MPDDHRKVTTPLYTALALCVAKGALFIVADWSLLKERITGYGWGSVFVDALAPNFGFLAAILIVVLIPRMSDSNLRMTFYGVCVFSALACLMHMFAWLPIFSSSLDGGPQGPAHSNFPRTLMDFLKVSALPALLWCAILWFAYTASKHAKEVLVPKLIRKSKAR